MARNHSTEDRGTATEPNEQTTDQECSGHAQGDAEGESDPFLSAMRCRLKKSTSTE